MKAFFRTSEYSLKVENAKRRGFFLVEVAVTLLIVSSLLFALMAALSRTMKAGLMVKEIHFSADIAQRQMLALIADLRKDPGESSQSGTAEGGGYVFDWEAQFRPVEETEDKLYYITLRISHAGRLLTEMETVSPAD